MAELASIADLIMGQSPPSSTYNDGGVGLPFFQGKTDFGFRHPVARLFCNAPLKIAQPNDILMSVRAPVGPTNIADRECCIGRGLAAIRPRAIDGGFLFFNLRYIEKFIASLGSGSTFHAINKSQLAAVEVNAHDFNFPEQRKIAGVLGVVQRAIEQQERLLQLTAKLKRTLLHRLFTQGLRGEPQRQTEIGPVPESWEATTLGELACKPQGFLQTGPFGSQLHKHDYLAEGIGVVNPTHLWGNRINHEDVPRVSPGTAARLERHRLEAGDILFARRGEIGRHGMVTDGEEGWLCGTGCFLARVRQKHIDNRFLSYFFSTPGAIDWLNSHAAGAIMPNLNNTVLRSMPAFFPNLRVQTEIADCLDATEQKMAIHHCKYAALTALFRTLLHQLMTAQIRVHDLDLPELEGPP
jgi:type I restriction enzyme S subunit